MGNSRLVGDVIAPDTMVTRLSTKFVLIAKTLATKLIGVPCRNCVLFVKKTAILELIQSRYSWLTVLFMAHVQMRPRLLMLIMTMTMMVWLLSKLDLKILFDGQKNPIYLMFQRKLSMPLISAVPSAQTHTIASDPSPADIATSSDLSTTTPLADVQSSPDATPLADQAIASDPSPDDIATQFL